SARNRDRLAVRSGSGFLGSVLRRSGSPQDAKANRKPKHLDISLSRDAPYLQGSGSVGPVHSSPPQRGKRHFDHFLMSSEAAVPEPVTFGRVNQQPLAVRPLGNAEGQVSPAC
ncbi:MAG: hypothetical protein ACRD2L_14905, partial [Terriglobia bacterium]